MNYRLLGRTGVEVSPLGLGCMMFGDRTTPEDSFRIIDRALMRGSTSSSPRTPEKKGTRDKL